MIERYLDWLGGFVQGDFGLSLPSKQPVAEIIGAASATRPPRRHHLALLVPLSLALGIAVCARAGPAFDHAVGGVTLTLISIPEFVVGSLLALLLAVRLGWLPPASLVDASAPLVRSPMFVLPVLTLLAAEVAQTTRMVRATMIDVLDSDYVMMARLKGVPERRVLLLHALPTRWHPPSRSSPSTSPG